MAYSTVLNRVHGGAAANTLGNTIFTFGTVAAGGAVLKALSVINTNTTSQHVVTINLVPSGGSVAANNRIFYGTVSANDSVYVRGPWYENSSATIVATVDAGTDVVIRVTANELT